MVRLVFRPYTQVWTSICTLEYLRASIRVSPDFALLRHSSPSFGSQQIRYNSDLSKRRTGRCCTCFHDHTSVNENVNLYFHCALGFDTQLLAYMLDSLVRVSRRVEELHIVRIVNMRVRKDNQQLDHERHHIVLSSVAFIGIAKRLSTLSPMGLSPRERIERQSILTLTLRQATFRHRLLRPRELILTPQSIERAY